MRQAVGDTLLSLNFIPERQAPPPLPFNFSLNFLPRSPGRYRQGVRTNMRGKEFRWRHHGSRRYRDQFEIIRTGTLYCTVDSQFNKLTLEAEKYFKTVLKKEL